jgi:hypothetical protein
MLLNFVFLNFKLKDSISADLFVYFTWRRIRLELQALYITTVTCSCYTVSRYLYQRVIKDCVLKRCIFPLLHWKFIAAHVVCINSCIQFATASWSHESFFSELFGLEFWMHERKAPKNQLKFVLYSTASGVVPCMKQFRLHTNLCHMPVGATFNTLCNSKCCTLLWLLF